MDKFHQQLFAHYTFIFLFLNDSLSKCQWIFTEIGLCIDIVEIWFGIADRLILSIFENYLPKIRLYFI